MARGRKANDERVRVFSPVEEIIILALIDPDNLGMSRDDRRCTTHRYRDNGKDVSKNWWNKTNCDPWFRERVADASVKALSDHLPEILSAAIQSAKRVDGGFADRRMLLEIAGIYTRNVRATISGKLEVTKKTELEIGDRLESALASAMDARMLLQAHRDENGKIVLQPAASNSDLPVQSAPPMIEADRDAA